MLRNLFYKLPPRFRFIVRFILYLPYDLCSALFNSNNRLSPPKRLIFIGSGDFIKIGNLFQEDFIDTGIIQQSSVVLDVGCGIGRSAIPLTQYLTTGSYEGFDIMRSGITWCIKNITTKYSNFNFKLVDLSNDLYKENGTSASEFIFPYGNNNFDLVIVLSVFTHMVQSEVEQYLKEISRVLKVGGFCYVTFFVLNNNSRVNMKKGKNEFNFPYNRGNYSLLNEKVTSANVAYEEDFIVSLFSKNNLELKEIKYGAWSNGGSGDPIGFQDRIIIKKIKYR